MRPRTSFKQEFLKKWMLGLQFYASSSSTSNYTSNFLERKKIIELSADVAMASARDGKTRWSRALIATAEKQDENYKGLVKNILGSEFERLTKASVTVKRVRSKKILRRSCTMRTRASKKSASPRSVLARSIAKRMVKKRTQVLKSLVPGGESMDDFALLEETLDYMVSLQARVDVMRNLVRASERIVSISASAGQSNAM